MIDSMKTSINLFNTLFNEFQDKVENIIVKNKTVNQITLQETHTCN
jgi:hypothetical protein